MFYRELTDAAAAGGSVTPSVNDSDGVKLPSEDMPSFDEWKQKEQEKTKNSTGSSLSVLLHTAVMFHALLGLFAFS